MTNAVFLGSMCLSSCVCCSDDDVRPAVRTRTATTHETSVDMVIRIAAFHFRIAWTTKVDGALTKPSTARFGPDTGSWPAVLPHQPKTLWCGNHLECPAGTRPSQAAMFRALRTWRRSPLPHQAKPDTVLTTATGSVSCNSGEAPRFFFRSCKRTLLPPILETEQVQDLNIYPKWARRP